MTLEQLPAWARELLAEARVARLGLLDESDLPRVLPVTFAVCGGRDLERDRRKPKRPGEPARVRRLRRRPEAALCVDVYYDDWSRLAWVELRGRFGCSLPRRLRTRWRRSPKSTSSTGPSRPRGRCCGSSPMTRRAGAIGRNEREAKAR